MNQPRFIYWAPRIISIIFLVFLSLFSLDVFELTTGFWPTVGALLVHNLPTLILLIVLLIAWHHEIVGAIFYLLAGLLYLYLLARAPAQWYYLVWAATIAGPAFLISYLFWRGWRDKKRSPHLK